MSIAVLLVKFYNLYAIVDQVGSNRSKDVKMDLVEFEYRSY